MEKYKMAKIKVWDVKVNKTTYHINSYIIQIGI